MSFAAHPASGDASWGLQETSAGLLKWQSGGARSVCGVGALSVAGETLERSAPRSPRFALCRSRGGNAQRRCTLLQAARPRLLADAQRRPRGLTPLAFGEAQELSDLESKPYSVERCCMRSTIIAYNAGS